MLTSIAIVADRGEVVVTAVELLDILQQALPGVAQPTTGDGTRANPWLLSTPQEWYYASKKLRADETWFRIGGRVIRIQTSNFYASDHGTFVARAPTLMSQSHPASTTPALASATPALASTTAAAAAAAPDRFSDDKGPSYPEIYHQLASDVDLSSVVRNSAVASQVRALLQGAQTMTIAGSPALPVMVGAMFISEVKRNYTAFHTGLMLLDLVEQGVPYGGAQHHTWDKILWHPDVLVIKAKLRSENPAFRADVKLNVPYEAYKDEKVEFDAFGKPVSRDQVGGEHPMASFGTVQQSKQGLIGDTAMTMNLVRQKEATIVIRWLCHCLSIVGVVARPSDERMDGANIKDENTSSFLTARANSTADPDVKLASAALKKLEQDQAYLELEKTRVVGIIAQILQERCADFERLS